MLPASFLGRARRPSIDLTVKSREDGPARLDDILGTANSQLPAAKDVPQGPTRKVKLKCTVCKGTGHLNDSWIGKHTECDTCGGDGVVDIEESVSATGHHHVVHVHHHAQSPDEESYSDEETMSSMPDDWATGPKEHMGKTIRNAQGILIDVKVDVADIEKVWNQIDDDGTGTADITDFYLNLAEMLPDVAEEYGEDCFACAYNAMDPEGTGEISKAQFIEILKKECLEHTDWEAHEVFKQFFIDEAKVGLGEQNVD